MAALNRANIPASINTYERLAVWVTQCLQSMSNGQEVNVLAGQESLPLAQCQFAVTADNVPRALLQIYLPIDYDALNATNAKTWMAAKDISGAQPHTNLLSD